MQSQAFLVCLPDLSGLPYFDLIVGLTISLVMDKMESRGRDIAISFSR